MHAVFKKDLTCHFPGNLSLPNDKRKRRLPPHPFYLYSSILSLYYILFKLSSGFVSGRPTIEKWANPQAEPYSSGDEGTIVVSWTCRSCHRMKELAEPRVEITGQDGVWKSQYDRGIWLVGGWLKYYWGGGNRWKRANSLFFFFYLFLLHLLSISHFIFFVLSFFIHSYTNSSCWR